MSEIVVVSVRDGIPGEYIGRPMRGRRGSPLGNPYKLRSESERAAVKIAYRTWLRARVAEPGSPQLAELRRLRSILDRDGRLVLVCWCVPLACHGDVVAEFLRELPAAV